MSTAGSVQYTGGYREYTGTTMMSVEGYHEHTSARSKFWGIVRVGGQGWG